MRVRRILVTIVAGAISAFGQTVTKVPNKLGLDVKTVSIDAEAFRATVLVHNESGKPITAYSIALVPLYSDGEKLTGGGSMDYFIGLGLAHITSAGPGTDSNNLDAIMPGMTRESTFSFDKPHTEGAQLKSIHGEVKGLIFDDETIAGDPEQFSIMVYHRDEDSREVVRWCPDVKRFSEGPVPKKAVDNMLTAHGPKPAPDEQFAKGPGDVVRMDFWRLFDYGLTWQSDDTATLKPWVLDMLGVRCDNAKQHLERRAAQQLTQSQSK